MGKPDVENDIKAIVEYFKPDVLVGAVGKGPGCFTKEVVEAMVAVQEAKGAGGRPIIFALSNPKTQAEITAADCYKFSNGKAIFGSGTRFFEDEPLAPALALSLSLSLTLSLNLPRHALLRGGGRQQDARAGAGERPHLPGPS